MIRVWVALTLMLTLIVLGAGLASDWPLYVMLACAVALSVGAWLFVSAIRRAPHSGDPPAERSS